MISDKDPPSDRARSAILSMIAVGVAVLALGLWLFRALGVHPQ